MVDRQVLRTTSRVSIACARYTPPPGHRPGHGTLAVAGKNHFTRLVTTQTRQDPVLSATFVVDDDY